MDPNDFERGWIAGVLDGEGSLTLTERADRNVYRPEVKITNSNRELVEHFRFLVPGGSLYTDDRGVDNRSTYYQYVIGNHSVIEKLLERVLHGVPVCLRFPETAGSSPVLAIR